MGSRTIRTLYEIATGSSVCWDTMPSSHFLAVKFSALRRSPLTAERTHCRGKSVDFMFDFRFGGRYFVMQSDLGPRRYRPVAPWEANDWEFAKAASFAIRSVMSWLVI